MGVVIEWTRAKEVSASHLHPLPRIRGLRQIDLALVPMLILQMFLVTKTIAHGS